MTLEVKDSHGDEEAPSMRGDDDNNEIGGNDGENSIQGGGGDDILRGGGGDDAISGGGGDDRISGGQGDDIIRGGRGDDILNGGKGDDRAVYSGDVDDYTIYVDSNGRLHIEDGVSNRDGNDTLKNFEEFNFNGTMYTYEELLNLPALDIIT